MSHKLSDEQIKKNVNKWGSSFEDKRRCYVFVSCSRKTDGSRTRILCKIKHIGTGQIKKAYMITYKKRKAHFIVKIMMLNLLKGN